MKKVIVFIICLVPPYAAALTGAFFRPGSWYLSLEKPWWTPPGWVFPVVWNILYLLMAISLYQLYQRGLMKTHLAKVYGLTFIFNGLWSPIFFGAHWMGAGLLVLFGLVVSICLFLRLSWVHQRVLFYLNLPYGVWLCLAFSLNLSLILLN